MEESPQSAHHPHTKFIVIGTVIIALITGGAAYLFLNRSAPDQKIACTLEAKQCPDGSYVGRTGPNCEFAECPESSEMDGNNVITFEELIKRGVGGEVNSFKILSIEGSKDGVIVKFQGVTTVTVEGASNGVYTVPPHVVIKEKNMLPHILESANSNPPKYYSFTLTNYNGDYNKLIGRTIVIKNYRFESGGSEAVFNKAELESNLEDVLPLSKNDVQIIEITHGGVFFGSSIVIDRSGNGTSSWGGEGGGGWLIKKSFSKPLAEGFFDYVYKEFYNPRLQEKKPFEYEFLSYDEQMNSESRGIYLTVSEEVISDRRQNNLQQSIYCEIQFQCSQKMLELVRYIEEFWADNGITTYKVDNRG